MAVLPMQRITICALKKDRKKILELLQRRGVMEIVDRMPEDSLFHKMDVTAAESILGKNVASAKEALRILEQYVSEKKSKFDALKGRTEITAEDYDGFSSRHDSVLNMSDRICGCAKRIEELKSEILKLKTQCEMLIPWTSLDISVNFSGPCAFTKHTTGFIGTLPDGWTPEMLYEKLSDQMPLSVDIISVSREQTCIFVLCAGENADTVNEALRAIGFSYAAFSSRKPPAEEVKDITKRISDAELEIADIEKKLESYTEKRKELRFLADYDAMRAEKYEVISHLLQSQNVFVITGFLAKKDRPSLEAELNKQFELALEFQQPDDDEDVPVLLSNNAFSRPLEGVIESYSLPGKGETDPTTVMSLFYYLLFGLMLSDAGYGAVIASVCGIALLKFKHTLEDGMKRALTMFFFCGLTTIFWGVLFGSYFGDIVSVIASSFFGKTVIIAPLWFIPVDQPMRMLVFSMLIGIIHLYTGLGMKLYHCIKLKDFKAILYDVILWYLLLTGCVLKLLSMQMFTDIFGLSFVLPDTLGNVAGVIAACAAVGITLTNGRESRNPLKRFLKGLYALYGITGYLSDVLSYSRLLALGLATSVICSVVNKMAGMLAGLPGGVVYFTIVCIFGHAFNLAINALGAYVHTNRLQYVEFFGKFYEGGGRKFDPFRVKTQYYKFKEES